VLAAVKLDDEFGFRGAEIYDERTDEMLAAESYTDESAIPKSRPQPPLSLRLVVSKSARVAT